jgi:hypothetical protein
MADFKNGLTDESLVKMLARSAGAPPGNKWEAKLPGTALVSIVKELQEARATKKRLLDHVEHLRVLPHDNGTEDYRLSALEEADVLHALISPVKPREGSGG